MNGEIEERVNINDSTSDAINDSSDAINDSSDAMTQEPINKMWKQYNPLAKTLWKVSKIYVLWIFIHYISSHLYVAYCTPYNLFGFIASPIMISTPHCTGIRWCIMRGADTITAMWIVIGTWLATTLGGY